MMPRKYSEQDKDVWKRVVSEVVPSALRVAHPAVVMGVRKLDLLDSIPSVDDINIKLSPYGWSVFPVNGFLSPRNYLMCLAKRSLPIATKVRRPNNSSFAAEPDIFHEVFGHLPLLTNATYSSFLQQWGQVGTLAFQMPGEAEYFQSVRMSAKLKALGNIQFSRWKSIESEAASIARLGWWIVECGLMLRRKKKTVFGAALLSSQDEINNALLSKRVRRAELKYINRTFDPTDLQSDYLYIESFEDLFPLLSSLSKSMAFNIGGVQALEIAIASKEIAICRLSSGRVIRGRILEFERGSSHLPIRSITVRGLDSMQRIELFVWETVQSVYPAVSERFI